MWIRASRFSPYLVLARDSDGMTGTLPVKIRIDDMNENPPHFTSHTLNMKVRADAETGLVIGSVTAIDPDGSKWAETYWTHLFRPILDSAVQERYGKVP